MTMAPAYRPTGDANPMTTTATTRTLVEFIHGLSWTDVPEPTQHQVVRAVADVVASAVGGIATPAARIMNRFVRAALAPGRCSIIGTEQTSGAAGAALANGCAANALDIDDGFRLAKGHPGAVIVPAVLAVAQQVEATGKQFLEAVAVGYEVAMRASVIWHGDRPEYHGSGSWGSVGAAAACARLLKLNQQQTTHALGIAEYHAPLADIMRCVRHPAMVKDGIHWGAFVGVTSAMLAGEGFTGIPHSLALPQHKKLMGTPGSDWWVHRLYFKFFPCCRWAQPSVAGALALCREHAIRAADVTAVRIDTFDAATALGTRHPADTEQAQYSLPYPVACAIVRGKVGVAEVTGDALGDEEIAAMSDLVRMHVDQSLEARFPAEALAKVTITLRDGRALSAGPLAAPGDAATPPADEQLQAKFLELCGPVLGQKRAAALHAAIAELPEQKNLAPLAALLGDGRRQ